MVTNQTSAMIKQDTYLNHAGTSWPKPEAVLEATHAAMTACPSEWGEKFYAAHSAIAAFFGIADPEQLLITPGCTSSLAVAVGDINLEGRKRVLTSAWEHHALHRPLMKLKSCGAGLEYIPVGEESPIDLAALETELAAGDIGLLAITAAANVTGDILPYESVIKLAHQYDAQVLLDAAQIVGWLDLDFPAIGADLIAFGGHKGLQGPWGIGGLYIAETARLNCVSAVCELTPSGKSPRPGYCDVGSVDQVALAGLHAAIERLKTLDRPKHLASAREQIALIETTLKEVGAKCFAIQPAAERLPTLAFSFDPKPSTEIATALKAHGVTVGSGLQCAPLAHQTLGTDAHGLLRISVGLGQASADIEKFVDVITKEFSA